MDLRIHRSPESGPLTSLKDALGTSKDQIPVVQKMRAMLQHLGRALWEVVNELSDSPDTENNDSPEQILGIIQKKLKPFVPNVGFFSISDDEWNSHIAQRKLPAGLQEVYEEFFQRFQELGLLPLEEYFSCDPNRIQSQITEVYWRIVHEDFISSK